jgi:hypothetical protein
VVERYGGVLMLSNEEITVVQSSCFELDEDLIVSRHRLLSPSELETAVDISVGN